MRKNVNAGSGLLVLILTLGVFGILNTEMGVIGMLPLIADTFQVTVPQVGWTVTIFALVIAVCGPVMPMVFQSLTPSSSCFSRSVFSSPAILFPCSRRVLPSC